MKYKVSQKVRVREFKKNSFPHWMPSMEKYSGKIVTIENNNYGTLPYKINGCPWGWRETDFSMVEFLDDDLFEI